MPLRGFKIVTLYGDDSVNHDVAGVIMGEEI